MKKGTPLVKLKSEKEESDFKQAKAELEAALQSYLFDPADETIRKALVTAQAQASAPKMRSSSAPCVQRSMAVVADVRVAKASRSTSAIRS